MENNEIILLENDKEVKYKVILDLEDVDGKNFIVYTKDDTNCFVSMYTYTKTGKLKLSPVKNEKDYDFIEEVLNSLQTKGE